MYKNLMRLILLYDLLLRSRIIFVIKIWAFRIFKTKIEFLEDKNNGWWLPEKHSKDEINLLRQFCKRICIIPQLPVLTKLVTFLRGGGLILTTL